jgi:hypothetical protein
MRSFEQLHVFHGTLIAAFGALCCVLISPGRAGVQEKTIRYVGAAKCKNCHRSETTGNQFGVWGQARHSHAFETLGTDRAKEIGATLGVEDPQKADQCIRCHRTGHGLPDEHFKRGFDLEAGVQCETCHGPGEAHMKARMIAAGKGDTESVEPGEMIGAPTEEQCRACHNDESPTYKHFCFACRRSKIRHLNPTRHSPEELVAMRAEASAACDCEADCGAEICKQSSP